MQSAPQAGVAALAEDVPSEKTAAAIVSVAAPLNRFLLMDRSIPFPSLVR
jgi:hypothetical protein